ncbi:MAG: citryl-CoA lyase [Phycisphaeraceae bacterium]|nr:citryl-CoA lyase [Phycisphaeraceae bacterium]
MAETWKTAISRIRPNEVRVRGYDIAELMGRVSFGSAVYLILRGDLPPEPVGRLMDAILVSSIDHGPTPPSALGARSVASTGASQSAAVAAGIASINRWHGGAIQDCAGQLRRIVERSQLQNRSLADSAADELQEMAARRERMSGFGHRVHTSDPRTARLFSLAAEIGLDGPHVRAVRAVEAALVKRGKPLPINVDGAIGALLADLGFEPGVMNGIFMIARAPGLVAHVFEEQTREKPMRRIDPDPDKQEYDGPAPRRLDD